MWGSLLLCTYIRLLLKHPVDCVTALYNETGFTNKYVKLFRRMSGTEDDIR